MFENGALGVVKCSLSQSGATALFMAAHNHHVDIVRLLLDKGAEVETADKV